jgi:hypothetical protein
MPIEYSKQRLIEIANIALTTAKCRRENAGQNGAWGDGGAGELEKQVTVFLAGLDGKLPEHWLHFAKLLGTENDPEYILYQRLKKKFENKPP